MHTLHAPRSGAALLGVNVDHIATLRQARGTSYPDPVAAAVLAELAGADQITVHLREDRRHIQDRDVEVLRRTVRTRLNLEMAATDEMLGIARRILPDTVTLVPERREEQTTEGGLDVLGHEAELTTYIAALREAGIIVSLFIDPSIEQVEASERAGAQAIELHTGDYCEAVAGSSERAADLERLEHAARRGSACNLYVAAGHGLDTYNVLDVVAIPDIVELNIGHSIIAQASLVGLERAVREMIDAMARGRRGSFGGTL